MRRMEATIFLKHRPQWCNLLCISRPSVIRCRFHWPTTTAICALIPPPQICLCITSPIQPQFLFYSLLQSSSSGPSAMSIALKEVRLKFISLSSSSSSIILPGIHSCFARVEDREGVRRWVADGWWILECLHLLHCCEFLEDKRKIMGRSSPAVQHQALHLLHVHMVPDMNAIGHMQMLLQVPQWPLTFSKTFSYILYSPVHNTCSSSELFSMNMLSLSLTLAAARIVQFLVFSSPLMQASFSMLTTFWTSRLAEKKKLFCPIS